MKTRISETRFQQIWHGPTAKVTIGPGFLHKAGFGRFTIPHLPLVNFLLRVGLPDHLRINMSFSHEFAHFKTAPVLLAYTIGINVLAGMLGRRRMGEVMLLFISAFATWEVLSEGLIILEDTSAYQNAYNGVTKLPRFLFWAGGGLLAAAGWMVLLHE